MMMSARSSNRRKSGIRSRFGITISVVILSVAILNVVQFLSMTRINTYAAKLDMIKAADAVMELNFDSSGFYKDIAEIESAHNVYIEIYKPHENLIYTTNNNSWIFNPDQQNSSESELKPRIMKVLSHKDNRDGSYFEERQEFFAVARYVVYGDFTHDDIGIILYSSVDIITSTAKTASWTFFGISMVILLVAIVALIIYTMAFVRPLDTVNDITKKIARMDFGEKCPSFRIRELDELSSSVNALSASLELSLKDLQIKNKRLEQEIEKERQVIEMRKQFTANASHELKTPLAIIQGYAEGLKYGITDESPEEYCDTIIEEVQKMNNLVVRLLEITKYDYRGNFVACVPLCIHDELERYLDSVRLLLSQKNIQIEFDVSSDYIGYTDRELIDNIFGNYISNAISHCENEKIIRVSCTPVKDSYRISVFNTGKLIAQEDIENIWQSFYRADKAHSRAEGRFGLGLSIVAAAQKILGRDYGARNHDDGVEFWFDIARYEKPKNNYENPADNA